MIKYVVDNEEILSNLNDHQLDLIDYLKIDKSHNGFLLSRTASEFQEAYESVGGGEIVTDAGAAEALAIEACILLKYRDGIDRPQIELVHQTVTKVLTSYVLTSLIRKGKIQYSIGQNDDEWAYSKAEEE